MSAIPEYKWGTAPEHLKTRKQLAESGLRPPQKAKPMGQISWGKGRKQRYADLFDSREAVPKRKETEAQAAARGKALEKRMAKLSTCHGCGTNFGSTLGRNWDPDHCPVCCRLEAYGVASEWIAKRVLIADFETTDLGGYAVELGIIDIDGNTLFHERFNPLVPIEPDASRVHGIRDEDVRACPTFAERIEAIAQIVNGAVIVAYNAWFDRGVLNRELERVQGGHSPCKAKWECAMSLYDVFRGRERSVPLPGGTHDAIGDCLAVRALVLSMANPASNIEDA
jgi:DNA polymerase III subunit epsilon